jgi:hypothetical protein
MDQYGGSIGGPLKANRSFFFFSVENLQQRTGLSFTEAVPSAEARRRIIAGEPVGSGAGQSPARTQAVAPLLDGFPLGQVATSNPLVDLTTMSSEAEQRETALSLESTTASRSSSRSMTASSVTGSTRRPSDTAARARQRAPAELVLNHQSVGAISSTSKMAQPAGDGTTAYGPPATIRSACRSGAFTSSSTTPGAPLASRGAATPAHRASSTTGRRSIPGRCRSRTHDV